MSSGRSLYAGALWPLYFIPITMGSHSINCKPCPGAAWPAVYFRMIIGHRRQGLWEFKKGRVNGGKCCKENSSDEMKNPSFGLTNQQSMVTSKEQLQRNNKAEISLNFSFQHSKSARVSSQITSPTWTLYSFYTHTWQKTQLHIAPETTIHSPPPCLCSGAPLPGVPSHPGVITLLQIQLSVTSPMDFASA